MRAFDCVTPKVEILCTNHFWPSEDIYNFKTLFFEEPTAPPPKPLPVRLDFAIKLILLINLERSYMPDDL